MGIQQKSKIFGVQKFSIFSIFLQLTNRNANRHDINKNMIESANFSKDLRIRKNNFFSMAKSKNKRIIQKTIYTNTRQVNWVLCLIFSIVFGWLGVDRFIMGKVGTGLLKLFTLGGLGVWWIVDIILVATKYQFKNVEWTE